MRSKLSSNNTGIACGRKPPPFQQLNELEPGHRHEAGCNAGKQGQGPQSFKAEKVRQRRQRKNERHDGDGDEYDE
jgi:hypothetical protein